MIFSVKIKFNEETVHFAVDALSYTIAEAMAHRAAKVIASCMYEIDSITKTSIKEVLLGEDLKETKFFRAKVAYTTISDSGKLRKMKQAVLISGPDISIAFETARDFANGFMDNADVIAIEETDMTDFFNEELLKKLELTEKETEEAEDLEDVF